MKDLPKYKITIDPDFSEAGEDLGVSAIAFTAKPAILVKGMAFSSDLEVKKTYFSDNLKYRICAPVMIPMEIYRSDEDGEYFVQFTEQEIDAIHQKFMANLTNKNIFNLEHNPQELMPAYVLEAWIVDNPSTDKAFQTYGIQVPKGTLMMTTQITDKDVYNDLVSNGVVGYSVEGFLGLKLSEIKNKKENMEGKKLPVGEYLTADGRVLTITENGFTFSDVKEKLDADLPPVAPNPGDTTDKKKKSVADDKEKMADDQEMAAVKEDDKTTLPDGTDVPTDEVETPEEDATETPADEKAENDDEAADEAVFYTKEEVDAKLDEIYKAIADWQSQDEETDKTEIANQETKDSKFSIHDRFAAFVEFSKENKY